MNYEIKHYLARYTAGGYPKPTYEGTRLISINTELSDVHTKDVARSRARKVIARELACEPVYVRINAIWEVNP